MNRQRRGDAGYSLVEMLISTGIMVVVTGAIFTLMNPAQGTFQAQPEVSDMQQRMRVGAEVLFKDLVMAGAGTYHSGAVGEAFAGPLHNFFAAVLPYRIGQLNSDPDQNIFYRPDAITLHYVPNTASQTRISSPMPNVSAELKVKDQKNCPKKDPLCGFKTGMSLLIFDETGAYDSFVVTHVQSEAGHLQHRGSKFQKSYQPDAFVTEVESHTYYFDAESSQLRHYDGISTDVPLIDNVVDVRFRYFGTPDPPRSPRPTPFPGGENCVFDATGTPRLPQLGPTDGSLVELTQAMLTDGPWCPNASSSNRFDADLFRVRKVRVSLRVQASSPMLRGSDPLLFRRAGASRGGERFVPDYEMSFEVSPRNLNLAR
jgi:hypothetical protein